MRPLSASESFAPAFERTKAVLFRPFQPGRSWKLAATAYLAFSGSLFLPTPLISFFLRPYAGHAQKLPAQIGFMVLSLIFTAFLFLFFYLGLRLQFARFDIVLRKERWIAPLWRRYAALTPRWLGLKLLISAVAILLFGIPLVAALRTAVTRLHVIPGHPLPLHALGGLFLGEFLFSFGILVLIFCVSLIEDFILPSLALEGTSLKEAFRRFGALLADEPGPLALYILWKALLLVGIGLCAELSLVLLSAIALIPFGLLGTIAWFTLHNFGLVGQTCFMAAVVVLALFFMAFFVYLSIGIFGSITLFFQSYALYFLGGRYPLLGSLLEPTPPPPPFDANFLSSPEVA